MRRQHPTLDLSLFQLAILRAIQSLDRPSGSDIQDHVENAWPEAIRNKRVYRNLGQLEERGLIEKGAADRKTNWHAITEDGSKKYERVVEWFTEVNA